MTILNSFYLKKIRYRHRSESVLHYVYYESIRGSKWNHKTSRFRTKEKFLLTDEYLDIEEYEKEEYSSTRS